MIIPTQFRLFGKTIQVEFVEDLADTTGGVVGRSSFQKGQLLLQSQSPSRPRPNDEQDSTFFHELVHLLLDASRRHDLSDDEDFVEIFSGLLHQAIVSAERPGDHDDAPIEFELTEQEPAGTMSVHDPSFGDEPVELEVNERGVEDEYTYPWELPGSSVAITRFPGNKWMVEELPNTEETT